MDTAFHSLFGLSPESALLLILVYVSARMTCTQRQRELGVDDGIGMEIRPNDR
jgi:hypothetical protein